MKMLREAVILGGVALFFVVGPAPAADPAADPEGPLVMVTHVDVMPPFAARAVRLLWRYREETLKDPGIERVEVLQQVGLPNHFTMVEEWSGRAAYEAHVSAAHTRRFRAELQPMVGAPFDERPHEVIRAGAK